MIDSITVPNAPGIYLIRNNDNGKVYIGSSITMRKRVRFHRWQLNRGEHSNSYLQASWYKYGESSFSYHVLVSVPVSGLSTLLFLEDKYIRQFQSTNKIMGYNIDPPPIEGRTISEEHRRKISEKNKGREITLEWRQKIRNTLKGRPRSEETRERISGSKKGVVTRCETWCVTNPMGISTTIVNLTKFCKESGLDPSAMSKVSTGKYNHYKGWKCIKIEKNR